MVEQLAAHGEGDAVRLRAALALLDRALGFPDAVEVEARLAELRERVDVLAAERARTC